MLVRLVDFIIGAPQELPDLDGDGFGNGAVYIYHGRRDGKFDNHNQVGLYNQEKRNGR